jgi:hypothetical protein
MKLYACKVRLHGSVMNEVPKEEATAAEVVLLRVIHGHDAVVGLTEVGEVEREDREERSRLRALYTSTVEGDHSMMHDDIVGKNFGVEAIPLPKFLPEVEAMKEPAEKKPDAVKLAKKEPVKASA